MATETALVFDDIARYRKAIPGPVSPYVAMEALGCAILLAAAGYMVTMIHGKDDLVLLLPAFFMAMAGLMGLHNDYKLIKRSMLAKIRSSSSLYNNIMVSLYDRTSAETLANIGCDYLSKNGELHLLYVINVPAQLPFDSGADQKADASSLLSFGMRVARRRNVNASASIAIARDMGDAVLEMARRYDAGLIAMGASRTTTTEKLLLGNAADRVMKKSRCDVIVIYQ
jgi:nucleotide-binding universal stress UspA family protein